MEVTLDVRLDGFDEPIGHLIGDSYSAIAFVYSQAYLARDSAMALSLSLPLDDRPYDDVPARAYFDNLLPERDTARSDIIAKYGLANDDVAGILFYLGKDCPGAISVLPEGAPPVKLPGNLGTDSRPLSDEQLLAIVRSLYEREPLPGDVQDPSPLAGVQSKIALTRLPDGRFAESLPGSGAPTTHIIKVPDHRHRRDPLHEHAAMELSRLAGFPTASTEVLELADIPALVIERYDRVRDDDGHIRRRHQEDFCQALGLSSRQKYERNGNDTRRFSAGAIGKLLDRTIEPIIEKRRFVEITLFDILIGNVDGHAKNFSLFHLPGGRIETTPRYDVMPTMLDRNTTDEFAYRIGEAADLSQLTPGEFDAFLLTLGFGGPGGRRRLAAALVPRYVQLLDSQIEAVHDVAGKNFSDLIATNIRTFTHGFGLETPPIAAGRDTFVR